MGQVTSQGNIAVVHPHEHTTGADAKKPFRQPVNGSTPTGWVQIGTPKKYLYAIFDTGSDKLVAKTWETVSAELASVDQGVSGMVVPSDLIYNHESSSSYHRKFITNPLTGKEEGKQSSITYGSGTAITDEGTETIQVGNRQLSNYTIMEITADSLQLLHTSKGIAGVLGLQHMKNKSLGRSLFSMLREADEMNSFGYCRGTGNNGTFIWGDQSKEGHELEVVGQMHWAVNISDVKVGAAPESSLIAKRGIGDGDDSTSDGADSDASSTTDDTASDSDDQQWAEDILTKACPEGTCTGILDTGSNIIAGPTDVMKSITNLVKVKPDCSNFDSLPPITLTFGGLPVTIPAKGYVMKVPMPAANAMGGDGDGDADGEGQDAGDGDGDGDGEAAGLSEEHSSSAQAATNRRWKAVFARLHKNYGVDLRDAVSDALKKTGANDEFLCMPALVPLDKPTKFGHLYVVGTPLLDAYYARWSFAKGDSSPKIHLQALEHAKICHEDGDAHPSDSAPGLMRKQSGSEQVATKVGTSMLKSSPTERLPEEITYPHWAKDLLHV